MSKNNPGWAGSFFGPLYAELYSKHLLPADRSKQEADFARMLLNLKGKRVLDLAAGFGRHARLLARDNRVCAFDLNLNYLQQARRGKAASIRRNLACVG